MNTLKFALIFAFFNVLAIAGLNAIEPIMPHSMYDTLYTIVSFPVAALLFIFGGLLGFITHNPVTAILMVIIWLAVRYVQARKLRDL